MYVGLHVGCIFKHACLLFLKHGLYHVCLCLSFGVEPRREEKKLRSQHRLSAACVFFIFIGFVLHDGLNYHLLNYPELLRARAFAAAGLLAHTRAHSFEQLSLLLYNTSSSSSSSLQLIEENYKIYNNTSLLTLSRTRAGRGWVCVLRYVTKLIVIFARSVDNLVFHFFFSLFVSPYRYTLSRGPAASSKPPRG
uniref:Uncharacterized protein n=1 Tax=Trichogramma kaykai TaxID=54128 RepID=A0ABD2WGL4_9HYME